MVLGVTDSMKPDFENYVRWIRRSAPDAEVLTLKPGNAAEVARCDGIVLTGGGDIHPRHYGREDAMELMKDVNPARDEFEFALVHEALRREVPVLGVCRGMQLFNVALGGSMIPDVQKAGYKDHSKGPSGQRTHEVLIEPDTLLRSIVSADRAGVTTSHHQAVERIGRGLRVSARSEDGLIESMEWESPNQRPFVLLVQWHPERMSDTESPAAKGIFDEFIKEIEGVRKVT